VAAPEGEALPGLHGTQAQFTKQLEAPEAAATEGGISVPGARVQLPNCPLGHGDLHTA
jgi:hypothetical protein